MMRATLLLIALASSAHANNVWDNALSQGKPERAAEELYETKLREGDEHSIMANTQSTSRRDVLNQIERAIAAYRAAAAARPQQGEPYYRIGRLLYSFYFECSDSYARLVQRSPFCDPLGRSFDKKRAEEVIAAWDAFEARSPLDPRLSVGPLGDTEILFDRAILRTKLATKTHLAGAAQDYEKILARLDATDGVSERVRGNLAETYMMLGRMEEALETYRLALRNGSDTATWYGYAVALDRDENPRQALEIIRSLGAEQRELFYMNVNGPRASTFFVPEGEKYYYFALVDEAFGHEEEAIANWRKFLASGAHPEFHHRAKAHLEALTTKKKRKSLPIDSPWPGLLR